MGPSNLFLTNFSLFLDSLISDLYNFIVYNRAFSVFIGLILLVFVIKALKYMLSLKV